MITLYSTALNINPHFRHQTKGKATKHPKHKDYQGRRVVLSVGPGVNPHWNPR